MKSFRTAAECIEFERPCPSIFNRKKDLAENTLKRIVRGLVKFTIETDDPFIVQVNHGGDEFRGQAINSPFPTISAKHGFGLTVPYVAGCGGRAGQSPETPIWLPIGTITGKNDRVLIAPHIIQYNGLKGTETRGLDLTSPLNVLPTENRFGFCSSFLYDRYGERSGQDPRARGVTRPLGAITGTANGGNLVAPLLYTNVIGQQPGQRCDGPVGTITTVHNKFNLISPYLVEFANSNWSNGYRPTFAPMPALTATPKGGSWNVAMPFMASVAHSKTTGRAQYQWPLSDVFRTITSSNDKCLIAPLAVKFYRTGICQELTEPLDTVTGRHRFGYAAAHLTKLRGSGGWSNLAVPLDTICAGATTFGLTSAWLVKHYGGNYEAAGIDLGSPLDTITAVDHHAIATAFITHLRGTHGRGIGGNGLSILDVLPTITAGGGHIYLTEASIADPVQGRSSDTTIYSAREMRRPSNDPAINRGFWKVYDLMRRFLGDKAPLPIVRKDGAEYLIYDLGMRMLTPRELLNAQFGPELAKDYILTGTRESQVAKIGNSVPPLLGAAVISANWSAEESGVAA